MFARGYFAPTFYAGRYWAGGLGSSVSGMRATQIAVEDAIQYSAVPARLSQVAVEPTIQYSAVPLRLSQVAIETPFQYSGVPVRVSQVAIELLRIEGCEWPILPPLPTTSPPVASVSPENVCQGRRMLVLPEIRTFHDPSRTRRFLVTPQVRSVEAPGTRRVILALPDLGRG